MDPLNLLPKNKDSVSPLFESGLIVWPDFFEQQHTMLKELLSYY